MAHSRSRPRVPRARRPLVLGLLFVSLVVMLVVAVGVGARVAGADPRAGAACDDIAREHAVDLPVGWTLECSPGFPTSWPTDEATAAMSHRPTRRIVVRDGLEAVLTHAAIAHEIAHAEASTWPPGVRGAFAQAVGDENWSGDNGPASPDEVFAESSVRCRGLPVEVTHPLVPCELVEAARTAGGAATSLRPVEAATPSTTPETPETP